MRALCRR